MPRRSYFRQITGGYLGTAVLSPPRMLFRPAALPMAVMPPLETGLPAAPTPKRQPVARSDEPGPAPLTRRPRFAPATHLVMKGPAPPELALTVPVERHRPLPSTAVSVRVKEETTTVEMGAREAPTEESRAAARSVEPGTVRLIAPPRSVPGPDPIPARPAPPEPPSMVPPDHKRPLPPDAAPVVRMSSVPAAPPTEPGGPIVAVKTGPTRASVAPEPQHREWPADSVEPAARPKATDVGVRARPASIVPLADRAVGELNSPVTSVLEPLVAVPRVGPPTASLPMTTGAAPTALPSVGPPGLRRSVEPPVPVPRVGPPPASDAIRTDPVQSRPVDAAAAPVTTANARAVEPLLALARDSPAPIRLEPPASPPRPHRPADGEQAVGVRIGSLEVRITTPAMGSAAPARRPATRPPTQPAAPLSRGFRSFGLVQG